MVRNNVRLMLALLPPLLLGTIAVALATNVAEPNWRVVMMFTAVGSVAAASWRVGAAALGGTITRAHGVPTRLSMVAKRERRAPVLNEEVRKYLGAVFSRKIYVMQRDTELCANTARVLVVARGLAVGIVFIPVGHVQPLHRVARALQQ